jgi:hypothetical protein
MLRIYKNFVAILVIYTHPPDTIVSAMEILSIPIIAMAGLLMAIQGSPLDLNETH